MCWQDPEQRPSVAELRQHDFLKAAGRTPEAARRNLASLARRRQAITLQVPAGSRLPAVCTRVDDTAGDGSAGMCMSLCVVWSSPSHAAPHKARQCGDAGMLGCPPALCQAACQSLRAFACLQSSYAQPADGPSHTIPRWNLSTERTKTLPRRPAAPTLKAHALSLDPRDSAWFGTASTAQGTVGTRARLVSRPWSASCAAARMKLITRVLHGWARSALLCPGHWICLKGPARTQPWPHPQTKACR